MGKEVKAGRLSKAIGILEKEAKDATELADALRVVVEVQVTKEALDSTVKSLKEKVERDVKYLNEGKKKLESIELTVVSEEEKAEARIVSIKSNEDSRIEDERVRGDKRIEEIRKDLNKKEQEAQSKIEGFKKVESIAEKAASEAVAKREEAERQYKEFKDKVLV